jgi:hypothetical protein
MRQIEPPKEEKVKSEEEDDRLPKWDTPSTKPKVDWETSISALKKTVSSLMEPPESAPFRSSKFPTSLLHAKADLRVKKAFKDEVLRTDTAGACGLAFIRCDEISHATLGKTSKLISAMKSAVTAGSPQDADSLWEVLRGSPLRNWTPSRRRWEGCLWWAPGLLLGSSTRTSKSSAVWFAIRLKPNMSSQGWRCAKTFPHPPFR